MLKIHVKNIVVQSLSCVQLFVTPWTASYDVHHYLLEILRFLSIEWVVLPSHLILCHLILLLPSVFPSIKVFSTIRWPKYCSFSISPSNAYSGLISFTIDYFDLLAVQGTLQHPSLKLPVLRCSAFFMVCMYCLLFVVCPPFYNLSSSKVGNFVSCLLAVSPAPTTASSTWEVLSRYLLNNLVNGE